MELRSTVFVIMTLALSGCCSYLPMADDLMFEVQGVAPKEEKCNINLLVEGTTAYQTESVTGEFRKVFYVSFCRREYTVQAICDGQVVYTNIVLFPDKSTKQPYNIGSLKINNDVIKP